MWSVQRYLEPPYLIVVSPGQDAVDSWLQQSVSLALLPQVCNSLLVITWWSGVIRTCTISCKQGFLVHPHHPTLYDKEFNVTLTGTTGLAFVVAYMSCSNVLYT